MKILVTGSRGNVGKVLLPFLQSKGHSVFGIDIVQGIGSDYRVADINHPIDLAECFDEFKPEAVFHLAGMVSRVTCEKSPALTIQTNLAGTSNIIQLCKRYDAKLIFFSTSEVYGNSTGVLHENAMTIPNNIYGLSKLMGEQLIRYEVEKGLRAIIVRPFMLYHENETIGDHRSAMIRFVEAAHKKLPIIVHKGSARSWLHMDEAVDIFERLLRVNQFETVNVGNTEVDSIRYLAELVCDEVGVNYDLIQEAPLPERMTLTKYPDLSNQIRLTGCVGNKILLEEGVKRVIEAMKKRL